MVLNYYFQLNENLERESSFHLIRRADGSLKLEYNITEPGLHSIMITVNGKHVHGKYSINWINDNTNTHACTCTHAQ